MDTSGSTTNESVSSRKILPEKKRLRRSPELKRQIVEESLVPGASVARVARVHGVNANQVFAWRRQYRQGLLKAERRALPGLLAVHLAGGVEAQPAPGASPGTGVIQVELPKGQLRLSGRVDGEALRVVLEALLG